MITGKTQLLGVMGYPVEHSMSPAMHNAAIAHLKLDYVYLPLSVKPEALTTAFAGLAAINCTGFNVTIPHKQAILPLLSEISPVAQAVGAVNTVWRQGDAWAGTNTDILGFLAPLQDMNCDWNSAVALILGYGGAARAVVAACAQLGCPTIHIIGRNLQKLQQFYASWHDADISSKLQVHTWDKLPQLIPQATLLVNTTPVGMHPHTEASPLSVAEMMLLSSNAIAYDLIYTPSPTQFLQEAERQGAIAIDGREMLVQQGAAALKIWLQQPVPVEVMRRALQQQLQRE
ncbi:shikimate dehydrogenase [Gloeocapsa sp. BRSZ]